MDRSRYDSAMFWLPFGTAAAVIGLALMTIGVTRLTAAASVWSSGWFDAGLAVLGIGGVLLVWSLALFLTRRRNAAAGTAAADPAQATSAGPAKAKDKDWLAEAVRGYYRERETLFRTRQNEQRKKRR